MDREQEDTRSLFALLDDGDKVLSKIQKKAILFVGKTKGGKSTCMQWMMSRPLLGYNAGRSPQQLVINYKNIQEGAQIKKGFRSGTLIPNIEQIQTQDGEKYSFADMAGYGDSRDYKGIITVAYMLKAVFDSIQKVKFIIVVTSFTIQDSNLQNAIQNFVLFVKMFDFKNLSQEMRAKIYKSTTIILTRTKPESTKQAYCERVKQLLEDYRKHRKVAHKQYVIELLQQITKNNKFTLFQQAKIDQRVVPNTCPLAKNLQDEDWDYLEVQELKRQHFQTVNRPHSSPFIMQMIPADQQEQIENFLKDIAIKVRMFDEFAELLKSFILQATQNGRFYQKFIDYSQCFTKLHNFLNEHDSYVNYQGRSLQRLRKMTEFGFSHKIDPERQKHQLCFGVQLMKAMKILYKNTVYFQIGGAKQQQKQQIQKVKIAILESIYTLKEIACKNAQQEQSFVDLAYVMNRACRQIFMLREIDPTRIEDPVSISSKITSIGLTPLDQLFKIFLSQQTQQFKDIVSKDKNLRKGMIQFGQQFKIKAFENPKIGSNGQIELPPIEIELNRIFLLNEDAKGLIKQKKYAQAIDILINLLDQIKDFQVKSADSQRQLGMLVDENCGEQYFINAFETLAICFEKIPDMRSIETARNIYQHISFVKPACVCWQRLIDMAETKQEKYQICINYTDFLLKYFQHGKVITCLQEAFRFAYDGDSRAEIRNKLDKAYMDYNLMIEDQGKWRKFPVVKYEESLIDQIKYIKAVLMKKPENEDNNENNENEENQRE